MRRLFILAVAIALVVAACGGSSDDGSSDDTEPDQPDTTQQAPDDGDSKDAPSATEGGGDGGDDSGGEGASTATVTINDETYQFSTEGAIVAQCLTDLFGIFSVGLPLVDGGDGDVSIVALHDDTDPAVVEQNNSIHLSIGDADWVADPVDVRIAGNPDYEGLSQVDSVQVNGNTVTGTATFVNTSNFSEVESATGTFEATCGEERTS